MSMVISQTGGCYKMEQVSRCLCIGSLRVAVVIGDLWITNHQSTNPDRSPRIPARSSILAFQSHVDANTFVDRLLIALLIPMLKAFVAFVFMSIHLEDTRRLRHLVDDLLAQCIGHCPALGMFVVPEKSEAGKPSARHPVGTAGLR